jgi:flagellar hook-basal body complex protein FliE
MGDNSIQAVLGQMRQLAAIADTTTNVAREPAAGEFAQVFKTMLDRVNETQKQSADLSRAFELGENRADLAEVMINVQKARLSFQTTLQVRNRLLAAYQDIMNMPL